jgi:SAM-dependent methyltransferase
VTSSAHPAAASDPAPPPDLLRVQRDAGYERMVRDEAAYWDRPQPFGVDLGRPETIPYQNGRFTGDPNRAWHETIAGYGTFRRGLVLGTSGLKLEAAILRANPSLHLTFCDISEKSLDARARTLGRDFPGRVETRVLDLNFADLDAESYDLIVSVSSFHHIINLEHLAFQANRALTADGYFFLQDFVAESQFAFSDEKRRLYEAVLAEEQRRHPELAGWRIEWPQLDILSPFEAVRSADTLGVLRAYLREERLAACGAMLMLPLLMRWSGPPQRPRLASRVAARIRGRAAAPNPAGDRDHLMRTIAPDLITIDEVLTEAGLLLPSNAFGVYRKRV